jgi:hypothetical protein
MPVGKIQAKIVSGDGERQADHGEQVHGHARH